MRSFKKYPNRRLYDLDQSTYVTVDDIRQIIRDGDSIQVQDSDGGDITRVVLMQILAEQEQDGHQPVLTNRAIEQIIRFYDNPFGNLVSGYLEKSILLFLDQQDRYQRQLRDLARRNPFAPPFDKLQDAMKEALAAWAPPRRGQTTRDDEEQR